MNLVAHQLLSFNNEELMVGNLLGDLVKGNQYKNYQPNIAQGILLHREIDSFTDSHRAVKNSTRNLHKSQGKYAPVVVDIMYDYLLIKNWILFSNTDFNHFKMHCYSVFLKHLEILPPTLKQMTKDLVQYDWFQNYSSLEGITLTLTNMGKYRKYKNNLKYAAKELYLHEASMEKDFLLFFSELKQHCITFLAEQKQ